VYRDVADLPAYRARELTYRELCTPQIQAQEAPLFLGFWGACFNVYRATRPHEGYGIVAAWRDRHFSAASAASAELQALLAARAGPGSGAAAAAAQPPPAGAFFSFTSNVDAHWRSVCREGEVFECHGNGERWQCSDAACAQALAACGSDAAVDGGRWVAPPGYEIRVDPDTLLAPEACEPQAPAARPVGSQQPCDAGAFAGNHPACVSCGGPARPNILFFDDSAWLPNTQEESAWQGWRAAVAELAARRSGSDRPLAVAVLEAGAGGNVTTVRRTSEFFCQQVLQAGGAPTLIRINPELPLADRPTSAAFTLPILCGGLAAVRAMDALLVGAQEGHAWLTPLDGLKLFEAAAAADDDDEEDEAQGHD
jgi:hypothetical protein